MCFLEPFSKHVLLREYLEAFYDLLSAEHQTLILIELLIELHKQRMQLFDLESHREEYELVCVTIGQ